MAVLSVADRHLVGRFSYGVTPALATSVRSAGGAQSWFEQQLDAEQVADPEGEELEEWFPSLRLSAAEVWQRHVGEVEPGWRLMADYQRRVLLRRMRSRRQLLEVMTELWENHLHVPVTGDAQFVHRADYGAAIRRHALGRFEDLLHASITHPAMLIFLDGAVSTARHPNENLGRELLELHTVGRGHYGEDDVKSSARILTGWRVDMWRTWAPSYRPQDHWRGPVKVMDFTDPNDLADGQALTRRYLTYLARHPATAQRVARRLAVKFVRDDPPSSLVDRLAVVYLEHDTEIAPVLRTLVASRAFRESVGAKVRDPGEDLVATYRALGVRVDRPPQGEEADGWAASQLLWQVGALGAMPFDWARPDGQPIDSESWSSPSRLVGSMGMHYSMSGGWWPKHGITYRSPEQWLPRERVRFDRWVDHLSRRVLARPATPRLVRACSQAVDVPADELITADHGLVRWGFPRLMTTLLDSPAHLTR